MTTRSVLCGKPVQTLRSTAQPDDSVDHERASELLPQLGKAPRGSLGRYPGPPLGGPRLTGDHLLAALSEPEEGFAVVAYALTTVDHIPENTLGRVRAYAIDQGWRLHAESVWDGCGMTHPQDRPGWRQVERLVISGFVQGIVTLDQGAVSTNTREYEEVLIRLESRRAFIAHVPHDWRPRVPVRAGGPAEGV
jgi:hypothetical protein